MKQQKVLFIIKNKNEASSRFRVFSYLDDLNRDFNVSFFYAEYKNKKVPKIFRSIFKRLRFLSLVFLVTKNDIIFMQRPMSTDGNHSTFFEWLLTRFNKNLIFDYDDAIFVENEKKMRSLVSLSKACVCGNDYLADFARQHNSNTYIIPTPINTDKFIPKESVTKENITIGWTGTSGNYAFFTPQLIHDIKAILQKYDNVDFLFICDREPGEKFDFPYTFIKWDDRSEVDDLQGIDIGLMPLIDSAWTKGKCGFKLIQYGSIAIASVASDVGVNSKVVLDGKSGFLINEENPNWAELLERLIHDQALRESMGKVAREHIENEYSVHTNYPRLKTILQDLNHTV